MPKLTNFRHSKTPQTDHPQSCWPISKNLRKLPEQRIHKVAGQHLKVSDFPPELIGQFSPTSDIPEYQSDLLIHIVAGQLLSVSDVPHEQRKNTILTAGNDSDIEPQRNPTLAKQIYLATSNNPLSSAHNPDLPYPRIQHRRTIRQKTRFQNKL
ncbi:hypothetical protein M231_02746 [Tremella mesenterica]|uniref:Uncharacterized protein n=1 Tax=Tremella mesenterica TaxID=5217 RepID=A0A4Q1BPV2_TREME|nr:hypothetical protein M231_02746 [Tremella mesenterica]